MSSTNNFVYRRWDELLEEKFDIFRTIIQNNDKELLAAVVAHDRLSPVDWPASYAQAKGPSALADKDDVLKTLRDILLKTNTLIREDTTEISNNFEKLAEKGGNEEEWDRALDDAEDLMKHKAIDQMVQMKKFAINRINSVDAKYRDHVGSIFGRACTALTGFQGSVHLFLSVARATAGNWYRNPWDNVKIFQRSTRTWYDGAEQGIKRAFPDYILRGNRNGADSLSAIYAQAKGPSTLADKDDVLNELKPLLVKTNNDIKEATDGILGKMKELATNNKATKEQYLQCIQDGKNIMENKVEDELTEMQSYANNKINSITRESDREEAREIFERASAAVGAFSFNAKNSLNVAEKNIDIWYRHSDTIWEVVNGFQDSTARLYTAANATIKKAFARNSLGRNRTGEDSLSAIQDMATKLQGMGVDNITIVPKGNGWALDIVPM